MDLDQKTLVDSEGNRVYNGITTTRLQRRVDKNRFYNFTKVRKSRRWLKVSIGDVRI